MRVDVRTGNRRKPQDPSYEIVPVPQGWQLKRVRGGYQAIFADRRSALRRGHEICRQLAPSRLIVRDAAGAVIREVAFVAPGTRLRVRPPALREA
jgi:hypothetical protein